MKRVTGIGGLFFKCKDPQKIKDWYKKHLGFPVNEWGATFDCRDKQETDQVSYTVWSPFSADTEYFPGCSFHMDNSHIFSTLYLTL